MQVTTVPLISPFPFTRSLNSCQLSVPRQVARRVEAVPVSEHLGSSHVFTSSRCSRKSSPLEPISCHAGRVVSYGGPRVGRTQHVLPVLQGCSSPVWGFESCRGEKTLSSPYAGWTSASPSRLRFAALQRSGRKRGETTHVRPLPRKENPRFTGVSQADEETRTLDLLHGKQTLYQLSYIREGRSIAVSVEQGRHETTLVQ